MAEQKENIRYIVRIAGKDLDGTLSIERSTRAIRGINHRMAKNMSIAFEKKSGIVPSTKMGDLTEEQSKVLEDVILNPQNYGLPLWSFNRQKDYESGKSIHLVTNELEFSKRQDFQRLSEIKTYRGLRHGWGLPVRGQRTKSTHRGKGPVVGVLKKEAKEAVKQAEKTAEKKPEEKKK